ncbi:hypothetical protein HMPREF9630_00136 [Peptoanaerobacter stomatis]|uniref:Uncharacterized protein n=1 Tax=Peptoanaerobacter stomatis TaxID=796937 RepID=V9HLI4_9FIRM|nr:hypothetical protein HMPREF9630_00136 [Peptoanaerobacter stomatis]
MQKFFTEQSFVDVLHIKPDWQIHIRHFTFLPHGTSPPFVSVPHSPEGKPSCPPSSAHPPWQPVLPDHPRSKYLPDIRYNRASGRLPQNGHPEHCPVSLVHTALSNLPADADNPSVSEAQHFVLPKLTDVGTFQFGQCSGSRRFRVKSKIRSQFLRRIIAAQIEQPCHEVDHIPLGSAAEAEEIFLVQLQARMPVIVERAASHAVAAHFQPIVFGGLLYADCRLDGFIDRHRKTSVHSIQKA